MSFESGLELADKREHPIQTQWHYSIMTAFGWVPLTTMEVGLVRSYSYHLPDTTRTIRCLTGYQSDYWEEVGTAHAGYHGSLARYLAGEEMKEKIRGLYR